MTEQEISKILIVGLDNSGKTCILLSLKEETNLLSYFSLRPTRGINIETFAKSNLSVWDVGGQERYRKEFIKNFNKHIQKTNKIIFVIDVQDKERYSIALEYLQEIINLIQALQGIEISVFLHKYDPNLSNIKEFEDIDNLVKNELLIHIKKMIPSDLDFKVFKTSVYTVFDKNYIEI